MDWLDEKIMHWKAKLRMKSLKSVLAIDITIAMIMVFIFYVLTIRICQSWEAIASNHVKMIFQIAEQYSVVLYSLLAMIGVTHLFYKNRIEEPLRILKMEAACIQRGDLSVSCRYESKDEFKEVCEAFEQMRITMEGNQEKIWNQMEEQRQIMAMLAHDIRTPMTVMQGYVEMLMRFFPKQKITEEKLMETLVLLKEQIQKINHFADQIKEIDDIESIKLSIKKRKLSILMNQIDQTAKGLMFINEKSIQVINKISLNIEEAYFDEDIILEVLHNLLSNAISFAENEIIITMHIDKNQLFIYVKDDGKGFSKEDMYYAKKLYYSGRKSVKNHSGIGLTICNILTQKHSGNLTLSNGLKKGAIVCATFR